MAEFNDVKNVLFLVGVKVDVDEVSIFLGGLDGDLLVDQPSQQRSIGAAEEGHGPASSPEQKGWPDIAERV